jgi:hypothetical protein
MNKIFLFIIGLTLGLSKVVNAQSTPPDITPIQCSTSSDTETMMTFENQSSETVSIYWISYDCILQFYTSIAPGETYEQGTLVTHPWVMVGDSTGQVLRQAVGISNPQTIIITDVPLIRTTVDRPDDTDEYQVQILYVLPSDGVDQELDTSGALFNSVNIWNEWFNEQTNGSQIRLDTYENQMDIAFVRLDSTDEDLAAEGLYIRDRIERELDELGFNNPQKLYAVYYGGTANETCSGGAWPPSLVGRVGAVYLNGQFENETIPDCNQNRFATSSDAIGYLEFSMLHEILHTLGVVPECAPHHTWSGHVSDTPLDLMYAGDQPWQPEILDDGNDDYYNHDIADCLDIADSAFLEPLPADAVTPPDWDTLSSGS